MTTKQIARHTLFGDGKYKHNLIGSLVSDAWELVIFFLADRPVVFTTHLAIGELLTVALPGMAHLISRLLQWDFTRAGVPAKLLATVNATLLNLGGTVPGSDAVPNFTVLKRGCRENEIMYILPLAPAPTADESKIDRLESNLESRLFATGYNVNVRVRQKPLRLEIDKAKTPTFALATYWPEIGKMPTNQLFSVPAVSFESGAALRPFKMTGDRFSMLVAAGSGKGKSQWALAQLLTLAYLNSPERLSLIVCDLKADDFMGFNGLPHLASRVLTVATDMLAAAERLVEIMEERAAMSEAGDRSFKSKAICFFVDELADIEASLTDDERKRWVTAMQRLSQRGRSAGFILIGCTQRTYHVSAKVHALLQIKLIGHASAGDATAAAGHAGVRTDKLPVGGFEIHGAADGERVQGLFVANDDDPAYPAIIAGYVQDVAARWRGKVAHLALHGQPVVDSAIMEAFDASEYDSAFLLAVRDAMRAGEVSDRGIEAIHKEHFGHGMNAAKRKEVRELVAPFVAPKAPARGSVSLLDPALMIGR